MESKKLPRIAAFGFRSIPMTDGSAGSDKVAIETYPRLASRGFKITAYNRVYPGDSPGLSEYRGIKLVYLTTPNIKGFDTFIHSLKATFHIIKYNTGDLIFIGNGGNSIFGLILKLFNKKVCVGQDGLDWEREKWPWYAKLYLYLSSWITALIPEITIVDNIYALEYFEKEFRKKFHFIPYGSEVPNFKPDNSILDKLNIQPYDYFLFVGRFIPDKGLQHLIPAFKEVKTSKKLVLVGGSPNPSDFENKIIKSQDSRILSPGYIYGNDVINLMKNAYVYIQPSDIEGLSPVILEIMGLKTPLICSDIKENLFIVKDTAITFKRGDKKDLNRVINFSLKHPDILKYNAEQAKKRVDKYFSWDKYVDKYVELILNIK
jgi:glycosyltransferase involved in cell wall biosynthesis